MCPGKQQSSYYWRGWKWSMGDGCHHTEKNNDWHVKDQVWIDHINVIKNYWHHNTDFSWILNVQSNSLEAMGYNGSILMLWSSSRVNI